MVICEEQQLYHITRRRVCKQSYRSHWKLQFPANKASNEHTSSLATNLPDDYFVTQGEGCVGEPCLRTLNVAEVVPSQDYHLPEPRKHLRPLPRGGFGKQLQQELINNVDIRQLRSENLLILILYIHIFFFFSIKRNTWRERMIVFSALIVFTSNSSQNNIEKFRTFFCSSRYLLPCDFQA